MRDSTYSAVFGALSNEIRMSSIANNLANVSSTAYKKDKMAFHDTFIRFAHDYLVDGKTFIRGKDMFPEASVMAKPRLSAQQIDFSQGSMEQTGNQLDFALSGEGFFRLQGADGGILYTRAGDFVIDSEGTLRTPQGNAVLVSGSPLTVPQGAHIEADSLGNVSVNGNQVGSFDLVTFDDLTKVERAGGNNYTVPTGMGEIPPEELTVSQGFLEKGNVEVVPEMVSMIEVQRAFTMYTKMMQTSNEMDTKLITQVGRPNV